MTAKHFYEHPAYVGYIDDPEDPRYEKCKSQWEERGFDYSVTWSLDHSLLQWLAPRLEEYLKYSQNSIDDDEHNKSVSELVELLKWATEGSGTYYSFAEEDTKKVALIWELIGKLGPSLWW